MMRWMINCQEHSILTSENMDRNLSVWERFSVWLHQMLCPPCSQFKQHLKIIREACRESQIKDGVFDPTACRLPDAAREHMKNILNDELHSKE